MAGDRQYESMLRAAAARLAGRAPEEIAARAGIAYDPARRAFAFESFGEPVRLAWPGWEAETPLEMWRHMAILQYLDSADGALPGDRWIPLSAIPEGGVSRGESFDRQIDRQLAGASARLTPEAFPALCAALGGILRPGGRADACADFAFMPRYPLRLNLWFADEEFPASGKILVNEGVARCLGVEAAGTVAGLLAGLLAGGGN